MKDRVKPFLESDVRNWCFQIFQALAYMHQRGYFHRDLKPGRISYALIYPLPCIFLPAKLNGSLTLVYCELFVKAF